MATDIWNGNGNWSTDDSDWSLGAPPTSSTDVEIQTGTSTVTTAVAAASLDIDNQAIQDLNITGAGSLTAQNMTSGGNFNFDTDYQDGGQTVTIAGSFNNGSNASIGNSYLTASITMTVGHYATYQAYSSLDLTGNQTLGTTDQTSFVVKSAAPSTLTGKIYLHGDADLEYASGAITTIANDGYLQLDGQQSRVSIGASTTNSALTTLADNIGGLDIEGDWSTGPGGSSVNTTVALLNTGNLQLDVYNGDGASEMTVGGVLTNTGAIQVGNSDLSADSTLTVNGLSNLGSINLYGNETLGTTEQATLNVKTAAPATLTGKLYIHGDSDVEYTSGSIASIGNGAELQLDGMQSRVSDGAGTTNSALSGLASNYGTFDEEGDWSTGPGGSVVSLSGPFTNYNTFQLDIYNGDGASTFTDAGVFTNDDSVDIGNAYLSANTTMTVANLVNNGEVLLESQNTGGAGEPLTTLNVNAAAPIAEGGFFRVIGNSLIHFTSGGIQTVSAGGQVELDGGAASIASGTGGANSALAGLTSNAGTFVLRGENGFGTGVTLSIAALSNTGTTLVDYYNGDGGTTLTIGGQLNNTGTLDIGNQYISAATTVSAASLLDSGALTLQGGTSGSTSPLATLAIASAASASVTGYMRVSGNAALSYGSGTGLTSIASTGWLELDAALSSIQIGASGAQNSALADLAINNGNFLLRGDQFGTGGVTLTISTAFTNNAKANAYIDAYGNGDGGTTFTIDGALHNYGTLDIGNQYLASSTVVQAASFTNSGHFTLQGAMSGSTSPSAKLEITAAAIAAVNGYIRIGGNATLSFGSGTGLTSIATGGSLELDGGFASVAIGANGAANSGLDALSSNAGVFLLRGNQYGIGGPTVTTNVGFSNKGTLYLDGYGNGDGGSTLNVGGVLNNSGALDVGNQYLSAETLLTATSLVSTGNLTLQGTSASTGSGADIDISGAAAPTIVSYFRIGGDATLNYGSGTGFTTIAVGGGLELDGAEAGVSIGSGAQNSGLVNLVNNQGTFLLRGDSGYGTGGVTLATTGGFTNSGTVEIDYYGGDGASAVSYNGTLTNEGFFAVGNSYETAATTVTATNLSNLSGQLTVSGSSTIAGTLSVSGVAYNYAGVTVNTGGNLAVSGAYIQYGGSTTVNGTLGAKTYTQNGGSTTVNGTIASTTVADHNGYFTYNDALTSTSQTTSLQLLNGAQLQFNAAVSASQTVTFQDATDVLYLTSASTFKGNVAGFVAGDTISLLGQAATSLAYSGGVLTVFDNSATVASFHLTGGSYTTSSFNLVGDNNGGVAIFV